MLELLEAKFPEMRAGAMECHNEKILQKYQTCCHRKRWRLVVFGPDFKEASGMVAHWAFFWCFSAFKHVSAVSAFPHNWLVFLEHLVLLHVCQQFSVPSFVIGFHLCNHAKGSGCFRETLLICHFSEIRV